MNACDRAERIATRERRRTCGRRAETRGAEAHGPRRRRSREIGRLRIGQLDAFDLPRATHVLAAVVLAARAVVARVGLGVAELQHPLLELGHAATGEPDGDARVLRVGASRIEAGLRGEDHGERQSENRHGDHDLIL